MNSRCSILYSIFSNFLEICDTLLGSPTKITLSAISSFFKYYGTELGIQKEELRLEVNGFDSTEWTSEGSNNGREARHFCRSKGYSIEGGTHEIQLNIIAKRVLGLPSK